MLTFSCKMLEFSSKLELVLWHNEIIARACACRLAAWMAVADCKCHRITFDRVLHLSTNTASWMASHSHRPRKLAAMLSLNDFSACGEKEQRASLHPIKNMKQSLSKAEGFVCFHGWSSRLARCLDCSKLPRSCWWNFVLVCSIRRGKMTVVGFGPVDARNSVNSDG